MWCKRANATDPREESGTGKEGVEYHRVKIQVRKY